MAIAAGNLDRCDESTQFIPDQPLKLLPEMDVQFDEFLHRVICSMYHQDCLTMVLLKMIV